MSSSELLLQKEQELAQLRERSLRDLQAKVTVAALPAAPHCQSGACNLPDNAKVCILQVAEKEQELEAANSKVPPLRLDLCCFELTAWMSACSLAVNCGGSTPVVQPLSQHGQDH